MNQLFAAYARGKDAKELSVILGEAALSETDQAYVKFADAFEDRFIRQGEHEERSVERTLEIGWELAALLPKAELKRIKELEAEHSKLKRMYADLAMENDALRDLIEKKL